MRTLRRLPSFFAIATLTLLVSSTAQAQTPSADPFSAMGFQKNHNYFSPESFEHYDTATGNVLLTFTDLTLPGNAGRPLRFQRTYNNQHTIDYDKPSRWSFGFPGIVMHIWENPASLVGVNFNDDINLLTSSAPSFVTADGATSDRVLNAS